MIHIVASFLTAFATSYMNYVIVRYKKSLQHTVCAISPLGQNSFSTDFLWEAPYMSPGLSPMSWQMRSVWWTRGGSLQVSLVQVWTEEEKINIPSQILLNFIQGWSVGAILMIGVVYLTRDWTYIQLFFAVFSLLLAIFYFIVSKTLFHYFFLCFKLYFVNTVAGIPSLAPPQWQGEWCAEGVWNTCQVKKYIGCKFIFLLCIWQDYFFNRRNGVDLSKSRFEEHFKLLLSKCKEEDTSGPKRCTIT